VEGFASDQAKRLKYDDFATMSAVRTCLRSFVLTDKKTGAYEAEPKRQAA
jgi:hypothetical protein